MMERGTFDALVHRLEDRYRDRPAALARHTWRWLLLGYAVILSLTAVFIGGGLAIFVAGTLAEDFGILLTILGGILITFGLAQIGSLILVDHHEPQGRVLQKDEAPELWKLIKLLRTNLDVPELHNIVLTDDFNAAIVQQPRLGIFGWSRSWLILGIPVALATSPQELASVLAHECGHLSKKHGHHGNRIYQLHQFWETMFLRLQNNAGNTFVRWAGILVYKFLNWYWPRFHARAFLLSRQNEFMADGIAVESTSAQYTASALWRIDCTGLMLENEFWKDLWLETETLAEPPHDLCDRLKQAYRNGPHSANAARWCDQAMQRVTNNEDSHPSLADRLAAIGASVDEFYKVGFPGPPELSAASGLLTDDVTQLESDINDLWRNTIASIWRDRHRRIAAIHRFSDTDENATGSGSDDPRELWNLTQKILEVQGLEAAEPHLRKLLSLQPDHVGATLALGQLRVTQGHGDGENLLRHVVSLQTPEWTLPAGEILEQHLTSTGQKEEVLRLRQQLDDFEKARVSGEKERTEIRPRDVFLPHGLSDSETLALRTRLGKQDGCRNVWLVQKMLEHFPDEKLFVACVDSEEKRAARVETNDRLVTSLLLDMDLPGRLFVVTPTGEFRNVARTLSRDASAKVFDRSVDFAESTLVESGV